MECEHCGTSYEEGDNFCSMCGSELSNACPHCGTRNKKEAKYCRYCGYSLLKKSERLWISLDISLRFLDMRTNLAV